jgi:hypothetical protein
MSTERSAKALVIKAFGNCSRGCKTLVVPEQVGVRNFLRIGWDLKQ